VKSYYKLLAFISVLITSQISMAGIKISVLKLVNNENGKSLKLDGHYDFDRSVFIPIYEEEKQVDLSNFDSYSIIVDDEIVIQAGINEIIQSREQD
jgi:hypothetical protein